MRSLAAAAAVSMFLAGQPAAPEIPAVAHDALAAGGSGGPLPALTQRMAKAYCQASLGVMPDASAKQLAESMERFEAGLARLRQRCGVTRRDRELAALEAAWLSFRAEMSEPPTRAGCALVAVQRDAITRMSAALIRDSGPRDGDAWLARAASRQAELAQRLATLYLARAAGVQSDSLRDDLDRGSAEFAATLTALQMATENTPQVARQLDAVALQWEWLRSALNEERVPAAYPLVVAEASDAILAGMESVAREYRALP